MTAPVRSRRRWVLAAAIVLVLVAGGAARAGAQAARAGSQIEPQVAPSGLAGQDGTAAPEPTPRLPDGTPNLGRVPGEKGAWAVPYITNMAARVISVDGRPVTAPEATVSGSRGPRGGAASEPHIPFMPWSAALYDYNSANESKYDPEGYCMPPGGPRMMATPYPMEII